MVLVTRFSVRRPKFTKKIEFRELLYIFNIFKKCKTERNYFFASLDDIQLKLKQIITYKIIFFWLTFKEDFKNPVSARHWLSFFFWFVNKHNKLYWAGDTVCKLNIFHHTFLLQKLTLKRAKDKWKKQKQKKAKQIVALWYQKLF